MLEYKLSSAENAGAFMFTHQEQRCSCVLANSRLNWRKSERSDAHNCKMAVDVLEKWDSHHQTKSICARWIPRVTPASLAARARACACAYRMRIVIYSSMRGKTLNSFSINLQKSTYTWWTSSGPIWEALNSEYNCTSNIYSRRRVCGPFVYFINDYKSIVYVVLCLVDYLCTFITHYILYILK